MAILAGLRYLEAVSLIVSTAVFGVPIWSPIKARLTVSSGSVSPSPQRGKIAVAIVSPGLKTTSGFGTSTQSTSAILQPEPPIAVPSDGTKNAVSVPERSPVRVIVIIAICDSSSSYVEELNCIVVVRGVAVAVGVAVAGGVLVGVAVGVPVGVNVGVADGVPQVDGTYDIPRPG